MKNLITRTMAGVVYVAVILAAILIDSNGIYLLGLLFAILAGIELQNLCCGKAQNVTEFINKCMAVLGTAGCFAITISPFILLCGWVVSKSTCTLITTYATTAIAIIGIVAIAMRFLLTLYDKRQGALQRFAYSATGWIYIAVPLGCLAALGDTSGLGRQVPLMLFVMIWLNDTGAYCVGSLYGKRRLFERLSPKKSWEGFWGGMAFSIIAGVVFALLSYSSDHTPDMSKGLYAAAWALIGSAISVAATWGDLFESLIKRTMGVKDSGRLIPGHGGILDRIDSLLFAAPVMLVLEILIFG